MRVLDFYAGRIPVLGICLGHQAIGEYYGGQLIRAEKPMHGKVCRINADTSDILFRGLPSDFSVVRYNSLILENLPAELEITARSENGEIMALRHIELMIHGVQFHPEAILTDFGIQILQNWVECYSMTV
jgi:anthranilate synthase component 2